MTTRSDNWVCPSCDTVLASDEEFERHTLDDHDEDDALNCELGQLLIAVGKQLREV